MVEPNSVILGDCVDVMRTFPDKHFDLVLTDPPYGVGYEYESFSDTKENLKQLIKDFVPEALRVGKVVLITPGNSNMHLYPTPDWVLAWVIPPGYGCNPWGFSCWQPILAYGKNPYLAAGMGSRPDIVLYKNGTEISEKNGHPCPKPIKTWEEILKKGSCKKGDLVLDCFAGSGTTAVACMNTGRNYVLIEKEPKYIDIINRRIDKHKMGETWF